MVRGVPLGLTVIALAACGSAAPGTAGATTAAATTAAPPQKVVFATACDKANDGQPIVVEGYLRLPDSFKGSSPVLRLIETDQEWKPTGYDGTIVGVSLKLGADANGIEPIPDKFTDADLKVHLADGTVVGHRTKVKVSGKVYFPLVPGTGLDCGLEYPVVEPAT